MDLARDFIARLLIGRSVVTERFEIEPVREFYLGHSQAALLFALHQVFEAVDLSAPFGTKGRPADDPRRRAVARTTWGPKAPRHNSTRSRWTPRHVVGAAPWPYMNDSAARMARTRSFGRGRHGHEPPASARGASWGHFCFQGPARRASKRAAGTRSHEEEPHGLQVHDRTEALPPGHPRMADQEPRAARPRHRRGRGRHPRRHHRRHGRAGHLRRHHPRGVRRHAAARRRAPHVRHDHDARDRARRSIA